MRILGLSVDRPKLKQDTFTTFRFQRRDRDWESGERVQVIVKPRSKGGGTRKGIAEIISKDTLPSAFYITDREAIEDGFPRGIVEMLQWFLKTYSKDVLLSDLNKLTLRWVERLQ